jgi:uncharacterized damage-inducible protein DinB
MKQILQALIFFYMNQIVDTWEINNRINLYLIDVIEERNFADTAASRGRTVGEQLSHIHNVRLLWIGAAMPELLKDVKKIEKDSITKQFIIEQFNKSGPAISLMIEKGITDGKIKNFKPHPTAFLGYIIAHEAHHRGQIILSLKQSGHPVDKKILFGLWEWGTK